MAENILLYFSDTGRGHRSATEAVDEALQLIARSEFTDRPINVIAEPVAENSHPLNRAFVELYNYFLRNHQHLMKYYYGFLQLAKPNETEMGYSMVKQYLQNQMIRYRPSVVVSMHPMTNHYVARAMKDVGLKGDVKLMVVVTDPNKDLWRGWACAEADVIVAPNELVKHQLLKWGMTESQIQVVGMPVHPAFLQPPAVPRQEFLSHLGLAPDVPTLCINAGWAGGGNMLTAYKALKDCHAPIQVVFLCGHNNRLYEEAKALAKESTIPTAVLPFHDSMPDLMAAVDAMVTKAGGLTTFECIARRLPMIIDMITPPMPQERGTIDILVEQKLAVALQKPGDIVKLVENLSIDRDRYKRALPSAYCLNRPDASLQIARLVLENGGESAGRQHKHPSEQHQPRLREHRQRD